MICALVALAGVILILTSAIPRVTAPLFPIGLGVFLLGWAVLPMFGIR